MSARTGGGLTPLLPLILTRLQPGDAKVIRQLAAKPGAPPPASGLRPLGRHGLGLVAAEITDGVGGRGTVTLLEGKDRSLCCVQFRAPLLEIAPLRFRADGVLTVDFEAQAKLNALISKLLATSSTTCGATD